MSVVGGKSHPRFLVRPYLLHYCIVLASEPVSTALQNQGKIFHLFYSLIFYNHFSQKGTLLVQEILALCELLRGIIKLIICLMSGLFSADQKKPEARVSVLLLYSGVQISTVGFKKRKI